MAVPSSGELELRGDIALEVYGSATGTNISLRAMSEIAGFTSPDAMTEFYGWANASAPSVTTSAISNVGETSLRANGNITSDGGASITERGFYVGTNSASPTNNTKYTVSGTTGSYNRTISVNNNTTYYCWAFATNSAGTTYGSRVQATTIQSFVPTYATAGFQEGELEIRNESGSTGSVTYYWYQYYINPITSAAVAYRTATASFNLPNLNDTGLWHPDYSSGSQSFVTNAQNYQYLAISTGISNYKINKMKQEVNNYPSASFSNSSFTKSSNINSANIFQNDGNGLRYGASVPQSNTSGSADMRMYFNYS